MKKITILLTLSVFFLIVGICESLAQSNSKNVAEKSSNSIEYIFAKPGETVVISYQLPSEYVNNWQAVGVCMQSEGGPLKPLVVLYRNGSIFFPPNMDYRISMSFDASKNTVYFKLSSVRAEDSGRYYFAIIEGSAWNYWSSGTHLVVTSAFPIVKNSKRD